VSTCQIGLQPQGNHVLRDIHIPGWGRILTFASVTVLCKSL